MKTILKILLLFLLFFIPNISAQNIDIFPVLQKIENGNKEDALEQYRYLRIKFPRNPQVIFLEGLFNEDGKKAIESFTNLYENYPQNKYADAALFRIYSYHFALGSYNEAEKYFNILKSDYPSSPYLALADKNIPSEKEETVPEENKTETLKSNEYQFTIQAGAFSNLANANKLKNEFEKMGYHSEIFDKTVGGTYFHVVLVGQFKTDDEAESFLRIINTKFNLSGIIISKN